MLHHISKPKFNYSFRCSTRWTFFWISEYFLWLLHISQFLNHILTRQRTFNENFVLAIHTFFWFTEEAINSQFVIWSLKCRKDYHLINLFSFFVAIYVKVRMKQKITSTLILFSIFTLHFTALGSLKMTDSLQP